MPIKPITRGHLRAALSRRFRHALDVSDRVPIQGRGLTPDEMRAMHEHMADQIERRGILDRARDAEHAVDMYCPSRALT